ncbi:MAG: hypothetical protein EZS28_010640 [Streblomastix strix]|uniref:Uncharacterized protein n=1 Tax=Streblomastix strix TaxID=222440 RepID=A0A5J4WG26_9EUKA|nr:MAG: hypothetical protein EZS28_010640 [Streblomastix strix]
MMLNVLMEQEFPEIQQSRHRIRIQAYILAVLIFRKEVLQVDLSHFATQDTAQSIRGTKTFSQPIVANSFIKTNGTQKQIQLANGDTSDIDDFLPKERPYALVDFTLQPISILIDTKVAGIGINRGIGGQPTIMSVNYLGIDREIIDTMKLTPQNIELIISITRFICGQHKVLQREALLTNTIGIRF